MKYKELLTVIATGFSILLAVGVVAAGIAYTFKPYEDRAEQKFSEACASVGGKAVWNKRYWECLK